MKIFANTEEATKFVHINGGAVFGVDMANRPHVSQITGNSQITSSTVFMKLTQSCTVSCCDETANAIDLEFGSFVYVEDKTEIIPYENAVLNLNLRKGCLD